MSTVAQSNVQLPSTYQAVAPVSPTFSSTMLQAFLRQTGYPTVLYLTPADFQSCWERLSSIYQGRDEDGLLCTVWCDGYKTLIRQETKPDDRPERIVRMDGSSIAEQLGA